MNNANGDSAFPSHGNMGEVVQEGMNLRDYFAAKAMQALIARYGYCVGEIDQAAEKAYECADAMIKERAK